ncbi:DUF3015 family protein [Colwellia psychrerythraea]|uniref:DUF3015 domain-containing protein n=1 Tax=Colwellia psychrerythraea (strain 34H / ATCC BAA-681) TaxID=167879 RepID=Q480K9_COLP3|nr:DUF3015 family protein [Colwellia psychrerythraea]AAZ26176.1 hypothetical protein CPS_2798 [Colwellia psychrerythraea 34H]
MKKLLIASTLLISTSALADAPGSQSCGWGNMLFAGQSGTPSHVLAATTNTSTGNNTFGMSFGSNGCSTKGTLTYGGKEMIDVSMIMDEFSEDVARGDGEAITAVAVSLGVAEADRALFKSTLHNNFNTLFPSEEATTEHVVSSMFSLMKNDEKLAKYTV